MNDATELFSATDDTVLIDRRAYPPSVALATAWHRYRWQATERTSLRLTRRGRIIRDMVAGAAVLSAAVFAQPISVGTFTVLAWASGTPA